MIPKVFLVDDDEIVVRTVQGEVEANRWEFRAWRMMTGALAALLDFGPDVVLLDVNLPDGDGYEICRQIREKNALEKIPVIFLTSNGGIDERLKGFDVGAQDYVVKPFLMPELIARIRAQLAVKGREDALRQELNEVHLHERKQAASLGGHRRLVTVMFNDIREFTKLSELVSPETIAGLLNDYFAAMIEELVAEQGTFDKFIGDTIMAFWNDPVEQPDHAERAVRCAVRMQRRLFKLNEEFKRTGRPILRAGIGINTGQAVAGNQGSRLHHAYTVLGDHVNIAARLMGQAQPLEIVISAATARAIPDFKRLYPDTRAAKYQLKGKTEPVEATVLTVREDS